MNKSFSLLASVLLLAVGVLGCQSAIAPVPTTTPTPAPTGQPPAPVPTTTSVPASTPKPGEDFKLTGIIQSKGTDTWVIGSQTFKVDANTRLDSGLVVGVEARVEYVLLSDGTKLAREIETDAKLSAPNPTPQAIATDFVKLKLVAEGFTSPVGLIPVPDGTGRMFVIDQTGIIKVLTAQGTVLEEPFLDLRAKMVKLDTVFDERGLLGLAFHPSFKTNGRLFVYYSAPLRAGGPTGWDHTSHISEFKVSADNPNKAAPASEKLILQVDEPQTNHNGGGITFGPDGFLYIPLGDGGQANDVGLGHPPMGNGQDTSTLLGSILRIDVDSAVPYGIPPDNPFVSGGGRPEIFAFGLRNPFRIAFDMGGTHELFVGDVGQRLWEEVDIVTRGGNYGWNIKEGDHCFDPQNPARTFTTCPNVDSAGRPLIAPIIEYPHEGAAIVGTAVIGGFVYRGSALPAFQGAYIFGDFSSARDQADGRLFIANRPSTPATMWPIRELKIATSPTGRLDVHLRSFGQDESGELYVLVADPRGPTGKTGKIYKIVP